VKKFIRIGVDLAKNYVQVHALVGPAVTRKLRRSKMHEFFSQACGSAHYWARELRCDLHATTRAGLIWSVFAGPIMDGGVTFNRVSAIPPRCRKPTL
jgi:hypothetical protein